MDNDLLTSFFCYQSRNCCTVVDPESKIAPLPMRNSPLLLGRTRGRRTREGGRDRTIPVSLLSRIRRDDTWKLPQSQSYASFDFLCTPTQREGEKALDVVHGTMTFLVGWFTPDNDVQNCLFSFPGRTASREKERESERAERLNSVRALNRHSIIIESNNPFDNLEPNYSRCDVWGRISSTLSPPCKTLGSCYSEEFQKDCKELTYFGDEKEFRINR